MATPDREYYIQDWDGKDVLLQLGSNNAGDPVMRIRGRDTGTEAWTTIVEILMEQDNFWRDANANFTTPRIPPPPPPQE